MDKPIYTNESLILPVDNMLADMIRVIHILTVLIYQHSINSHLDNYPQKLLIEKKTEKRLLKMRNRTDLFSLTMFNCVN
ncbi:hypothetical protein C8C77_1299 [Halanaerobium saccharolyticum]|uniref:Uncharacterized protein n=1 Tax=Halanaerobium saccharolyticum TaxID=43595 RepID=A0A4R7YS25_9FIRM|nr:hypothetical protein [Halanaerobium saccharolyticum]RAK05430.1 hypothetical protein C7958_1269 [Halanaerobium saccharolyticum]TDV99765.1 hypothetical protein C8C77_1299 [Halanaerobium saccharolyticum]TDX51987.1 hypothetical protein C7956_1289 [Halanaerobium saccharolyticum]